MLNYLRRKKIFIKNGTAVLLISLAMASYAENYSYSKTVTIRVSIFNRISKENEVGTKGWRILYSIPGKQAVKTADSPDRLEKFIARSMIKSTTILYYRYLEIALGERSRGVIRPLFEMDDELTSSGRLNKEILEQVLQNLREQTVIEILKLDDFIRTTSDRESAKVVQSKKMAMEELQIRITQLMDHWNVYNRALHYGGSFTLTAKITKSGFLNIHEDITIKRVPNSGCLSRLKQSL